jgi:hypothetical protein
MTEHRSRPDATPALAARYPDVEKTTIAQWPDDIQVDGSF